MINILKPSLLMEGFRTAQNHKSNGGSTEYFISSVVGLNSVIELTSRILVMRLGGEVNVAAGDNRSSLTWLPLSDSQVGSL